MIKKIVAPLLLCAAFAGFSTQANAVVNEGGKTLVSRVPVFMSCNVKLLGGRGFNGFMWGTVETYSDRKKTVLISQLKIQRYGGQAGGNKANFEAHMTQGGNSYASVYSGDNLRQDGILIPFDRRMAAYHVDRLRIKFTFDKSGPDPVCTSSIAI